MPEPVVVDTGRDRIILSTIIGQPGAADALGNLVLFSADGAVLDDASTTGLANISTEGQTVYLPMMLDSTLISLDCQ